jgi:predicted TIM-barrel fold metal-dependent hydrolase
MMVAKEVMAPVVALEEHYQDPDLASLKEAKRALDIAARLDDVGELRLREMDEAGIDIQVISHRGPSPQDMESVEAVRAAASANDRLFDIVSAHRTRFAGFAALPTPNAVAAADELERAAAKLGFKGGMVHGLTNGVFLDDRQFWPIFERAQALDVPIYIHCASPHPAVVNAYYKDYANSHPMLLRAGWSYTVETATQAVRLVLSGVFDAYPRLKIIIGHLGESLPFSMWRINRYLSLGAGRSFRDIFCKHFFITTSGNFSTPALRCAIDEVGIDKILFSIDWPYESNKDGVEWIKSVPMDEDGRRRIMSANACRLLNL